MAITRVNNRVIDGAMVNVLAYGAIADGVDTGSAFTGTDNTTAFQTALDAAGAVLYVPAGEYRFAANTTADGDISFSMQYNTA